MPAYVDLRVHFQKMFKIEIFPKVQCWSLVLIWIINTCPWCYKWSTKQHSSIAAHFQQKCCFSVTNVDFSCFCTFIQINICCRKTTFLLKMGNNDAMLLPASNIPSWAHVDNSNQHPSTILRFSKNLDFWQILKIDFKHHICCHVYDLSNIKNWQHIVGGVCGKKSAT